jgi:hypothetical protein
MNFIEGDSMPLPQSVKTDRRKLDANQEAHRRIETAMITGFETVEKNIAEIKRDLKTLNVAMTKLVLVEERQSNLLGLSEQNALAISDVWKEINKLHEENTVLRVELAQAAGVNHERGKLIWQIVAILGALGVTVMGALLLQ